MNQVRFAPAGLTKGLKPMIASLLAMGAVAVGLLGPSIAAADVNNCSQTGFNVVCIGQINGAPVTVDVGGVGNGNDLNVLTNNLNDAFASVANISDINALAADLTTSVQTIVNTVITTTTTTTAKSCTAAVTPPATGPATITIACA
jgi:hypothetical protein